MNIRRGSSAGHFRAQSGCKQTNIVVTFILSNCTWEGDNFAVVHIVIYQTE